MAESTYFGLPQFRVAGITPLTTHPGRQTVSTDGLTGLKVANISLPSGSFSNVPATTNGQILSYGGLNTFEVAQNRPIQPRVNIDVTQDQANLTAMGSLITALTSNDLTNFNPSFARPVVDNSSHEPEAQFSDVIFPATLEDTFQEK